MLRTSALMLMLAFVAAGSACSPGSSPGAGPNGSAGGPDGAGGSDPDPSAMAGGTSLPDGDAGAPAEVAGGGSGGTAPVDISSAGAPPDDIGTTDPNDPTSPAYPFDLSVATTALGESLAASQEVRDATSVDYSLLGPTTAALLQQTHWSTAGEAEFECSRATAGGGLVVGPASALFVASDGVWFAADTTCTKVVVTSSSSYSASLTRSFAQTVLGAP